MARDPRGLFWSFILAAVFTCLLPFVVGMSLVFPSKASAVESADVATGTSTDFPVCWFVPTHVHLTNLGATPTKVAVEFGDSGWGADWLDLPPFGHLDLEKGPIGLFPPAINVSVSGTTVHVVTDGC